MFVWVNRTTYELVASCMDVSVFIYIYLCTYMYTHVFTDICRIPPASSGTPGSWVPRFNDNVARTAGVMSAG